MDQKKEYFDIQITELQLLSNWAARCAEKALPIFERVETNDQRPREAISAAKRFASSGKRTHDLRKLALDAWRAAKGSSSEAAFAAARSASLAASSAYTHPFRDRDQAKHILGSAVYAALAIELSTKSAHEIGDREIKKAIASIPADVARLLGKMPEQEDGKKRIDQLYCSLDQGIRHSLVDAAAE